MEFCFLLYLNRVQLVHSWNWDEPRQSRFSATYLFFVALLGLLAYEKELVAISHLLFLNAFVMLECKSAPNGSRSELGCWFGVLSQAGKAAVACGCDWSGLAGICMSRISNCPVRKAALKERFPVRQLADRGMAVFRADLSDESAAAGVGEADSRKRLSCGGLFWWLAIWNSALEDGHAAVLGHGYGFHSGI